MRAFKLQFLLDLQFSKKRCEKLATSVLICMSLGHKCSPTHLAKFKMVNSGLCQRGEFSDVTYVAHLFNLYVHFFLYHVLVSVGFSHATTVKLIPSSFIPVL